MRKHFKKLILIALSLTIVLQGHIVNGKTIGQEISSKEYENILEITNYSSKELNSILEMASQIEEKHSLKVLKNEDFNELSRVLKVPTEQLIKSWNEYLEKEDQSSNGTINMIGNSKSEIFLASSAPYVTHNNDCWKPFWWLARYWCKAISQSSVTIDYIEARARIYCNGYLEESGTDTNTHATYSGIEVSYLRGANHIGDPPGLAYANNVWKHQGYQDAYNQDQWTWVY
ncbi:hypothetical protein BHU72_09915 [Desulfuribacillus stibiiarsenatis]|uniref:Uncharacterized protein n=1 Tax=Desulfuribacillus stibiiarsenatis TaxID=1390249 RepID=A0A1E5L359_9FIRM|nr:hypothetical protein [Desulfuribacillus stibiiarsenatis]OEH84511.1 hypothetical protein BHU72_09915 [Desulfuribacillus stibiiarsenatis]